MVSRPWRMNDGVSLDLEVALQLLAVLAEGLPKGHLVARRSRRRSSLSVFTVVCVTTGGALIVSFGVTAGRR